MSDIIRLTGKVQYPITLDPSVWIFDDRKIELEKCFGLENEKEEDLEGYAKSISKRWEKERAHGANFPPVNRSLRRHEKDKILQGTFVMPFQPFIEHACPEDGTDTVEVCLKDGTSEEMEFSKIKNAFLCFSKNGKPLREDGPVHLYFKDGSNRDNPIRNIVEFRFK